MARHFAELVAEKGRIEVVWAGLGLTRSDSADVIIVAGRPFQNVADGPIPIVLLADYAAEKLRLSRNLRACLPLNASPEELRAAVIAVANELTVLTQEQAAVLLSRADRRFRQDQFTGMAEALTQRELEVLRMVAAGLANKEIAAELGVSTNTVKFHVAQIMAKLGAMSRTEAAYIGVRRGLVPV